VGQSGTRNERKRSGPINVSKVWWGEGAALSTELGREEISPLQGLPKGIIFLARTIVLEGNVKEF
jgi:hypothetical protein